jgi:hypothetical protein
MFGLSGCTIVFHIISYTALFSGNIIIEHKIALIFSEALSEAGLSEAWSKEYIGLPAMYPLFL